MSCMWLPSVGSHMHTTRSAQKYLEELKKNEQ